MHPGRVGDEGAVDDLECFAWLAGRSVANTTTIFLNVVDPGGVASFNEGLSASLGFLANLGRVLILALGVALPFIWLGPIAMWLLWRLRSRSDESDLATAD